jgi:aldehyde dehydrogenase (NAD+)
MSDNHPSAVRSFDQVFVGGSWQDPAGDGVIEVISPITEQVVATVPDPTPEDVDRAVTAARRAFDDGPWPRMSAAERADALRRVADEVEKRVPDMSASFVEEIGAPQAVSQAFHGNAMAMWHDAADLVEGVDLEEHRTWDGGSALVLREPVGVVGAVIPWNGPVATASFKLAAPLAAGCTTVLKPAPEGPVSTLLLAEAIEAAGLPDGVVSILPAGRETGEHLVRHPGVDHVAFTGSTAAGKRVMALAAERIARVTLELGGKSAGIVLDDVPLEEVVPGLVFGGIGHSGQVCAAITRLLVSRERHDEFVAAAKEMLEGLAVGDPRDAATMIGPLAAERQRDRVEGYIAAGREEGARLVTGGGRPAHLDTGWYVEPTLFAEVDNSMRIAQEEIFGPVLSVIPYDSVDEAVKLANDSAYGLSGSVYTADKDRAIDIARRMRTGQVFVNDASMCVVQPFGGYKQSGIGREGGIEGLMTYYETKVVGNV